jgi:hypothetical protein
VTPHFRPLRGRVLVLPERRRARRERSPDACTRIAPYKQKPHNGRGAAASAASGHPLFRQTLREAALGDEHAPEDAALAQVLERLVRLLERPRAERQMLGLEPAGEIDVDHLGDVGRGESA